jgi:hypothetical protein
MRAPISERAEKLLRDPTKARSLIEAIRSTREKRTDSAPVTVDHQKLNVQIVRIDRPAE